MAVGVLVAVALAVTEGDPVGVFVAAVAVVVAVAVLVRVGVAVGVGVVGGVDVVVGVAMLVTAGIGVVVTVGTVGVVVIVRPGVVVTLGAAVMLATGVGDAPTIEGRLTSVHPTTVWFANGPATTLQVPRTKDTPNGANTTFKEAFEGGALGGSSGKINCGWRSNAPMSHPPAAGRGRWRWSSVVPVQPA